MTRAKTNTTCCYCARSVPFDDPGYLCLPGWDYFSHFNRELEHVFTHAILANFRFKRVLHKCPKWFCKDAAEPQPVNLIEH